MFKSDFKDLRKAAFSIAFGVTMGKFAAEAVISVLSGIGLGILAYAAKHDNQIAKDVCDKNNIKYESDTNEQEVTNKVIGFHCE